MLTIYLAELQSESSNAAINIICVEVSVNAFITDHGLKNHDPKHDFI